MATEEDFAPPRPDAAGLPDERATARVSVLPTYFAPPQRASREEVARGVRALAENHLVSALLESSHIPIMVLNEQRQILAANRSLLATLGIADPEAVVGVRPGEAASCSHAWDQPAGCGTSRHCATCGAGQAIVVSQQQHAQVERECRLLTDNAEPLEFAVKASPLRVGEREMTVLAFRDISSELRRAALERTFFHDVLNTVGGLHGWSTILQRIGEGQVATVGGKIAGLVDQLTREIMEQRDLLEAEAGRLEVELQALPAAALVADLAARFDGHDLCQSRTLEIDPPSAEDQVRTDRVLAVRVLTNMVKNALEATPSGGVVRVSAHASPAGPLRFQVWNAPRIPTEVALQIFQRSFSTKGGKGRGLGTYSMKLFGERFLHGRVSFDTDDSGTRFYFDIPRA